jgi:hypothetical protein
MMCENGYLLVTHNLLYCNNFDGFFLRVTLPNVLLNGLVTFFRANSSELSYFLT